MTSVLVDTNVFIDVFGPVTQHKEWSTDTILRLRPEAKFILTPIVWSELASMAPSEDELMRMLARLELVREPVPFSAAYDAGIAHAAYRRAGGLRERTLPDFLIGAHAVVRSHQLLTRDGGRYRSYFPSLDLITPETHP
ncbi:MAG: type II toxin-antitoxin system VapC family toxin [Pseudorhizobium sp.]